MGKPGAVGDTGKKDKPPPRSSLPRYGDKMIHTKIYGVFWEYSHARPLSGEEFLFWQKNALPFGCNIISEPVFIITIRSTLTEKAGAFWSKLKLLGGFSGR